MGITGNYENRFNTNFLGEIKLTPQQKDSLQKDGVVFNPNIKIADIKDLLPKVVKEETVKNEDGTTSTVKTYNDGLTVTITDKKDENGKSYEEQIQKYPDGSLHAEIIRYPGKSENVKIYDRDGNIELKQNKTFAADGKTVKTDDLIEYCGKDANGSPKITNESHTYENGNKASIQYDENGKPESATVNSKEGKDAVELGFDLTDSNLEAGNVKLDEKGWPITADGKFPKIKAKVTNPGLPTSMTHEYKYNDDGSITELLYPTEGGGQEGKIHYKTIEDLRNNHSTLDDVIREMEDKLRQTPPTNVPSDGAEPTAPDEVAPEEKPDNKKTESPQPKQEEQPQYKEHKIQRGDTLSAIARKYDTTIAELVKLNNIKNPDLIIAGKTLKIPTKQTQTEVIEDKPAVEETQSPKEQTPTENIEGKHTDAQNTYNPRDKADGYIDPTVQQGTGDCWLLSGLNALTENKWGRDAIKQAIDIKPNGDITITLKGAYGNKKHFTITKAELENAKNNDKYSSGDMDVLAIELAVEKYRKQFGETLDGGHEEEIFRLITGSHNTQILESKSAIKNLIQKAKANPEKYAISANFYLGQSAGRDAYHAYNVSRFETDENGQKYVILTNPWDSRREVRITESEFMDYVVEMQVLANPKGNTSTAAINSDGKIGETTGGKKGVDRNVIAAIHAVANMDPKIIQNSIKRDGNGNLKVTLKGVGQTFTVTPKEIAKAKDSGKYTQGDDDVIALEIAMEKYGKQKYQTGGLADAPAFAGAVQAGTDIYGISDSTAIYLLTGNENNYAVLGEDGKYKISDAPAAPFIVKDIDIKNLLS